LETFVREAGKALKTRVALTPLGEDDVHRLVAAHLGGHEIAREVTQQLAHYTNGSPFAIGQYVQAMLEAGLVQPYWGSWRVETKGLEKMRLSTDVAELVLQRAERLSDATKQVLSVAALIGNSFDNQLLPAACELGEQDVLNALAEAARANLIE